MKYPAIVLRQPGGPDALQLEDVTVSAPGPGQVQIRHTAIGANYHDVYVRSGLYNTLPMPGIPGIEAVGVITALGADVTDHTVGERVAYITKQYGAYANQRVIAVDQLIPVPENIKDEVAASHLLKGLTAYGLTHDVYRIEAGDYVLVHAAAGGVGGLITQWAASRGAIVIGTVGNEAKAQIALNQGCSHVIQYRNENFVQRVKEITSGEGVQVVYDSVGKDTFSGSLDCLSPSGHLANFGQASGPIPPFEVSLLFPKSNSLSRMSVFAHFRNIDKRREVSKLLFEALADGTLTPGTIQTFGLAQAADAHRALESRERAGSVVIIP